MMDFSRIDLIIQNVSFQMNMRPDFESKDTKSFSNSCSEGIFRVGEKDTQDRACIIKPTGIVGLLSKESNNTLLTKKNDNIQSYYTDSISSQDVTIDMVRSRIMNSMKSSEQKYENENSSITQNNVISNSSSNHTEELKQNLKIAIDGSTNDHLNTDLFRDKSTIVIDNDTTSLTLSQIKESSESKTILQESEEYSTSNTYGLPVKIPFEEAKIYRISSEVQNSSSIQSHANNADHNIDLSLDTLNTNSIAKNNFIERNNHFNQVTNKINDHINFLNEENSMPKEIDTFFDSESLEQSIASNYEIPMHISEKKSDNEDDIFSLNNLHEHENETSSNFAFKQNDENDLSGKTTNTENNLSFHNDSKLDYSEQEIINKVNESISVTHNQLTENSLDQIKNTTSLDTKIMHKNRKLFVKASFANIQTPWYVNVSEIKLQKNNDLIIQNKNIFNEEQSYTIQKDDNQGIQDIHLESEIQSIDYEKNIEKLYTQQYNDLSEEKPKMSDFHSYDISTNTHATELNHDNLVNDVKQFTNDESEIVNASINNVLEKESEIQEIPSLKNEMINENISHMLSVENIIAMVLSYRWQDIFFHDENNTRFALCTFGPAVKRRIISSADSDTSSNLFLRNKTLRVHITPFCHELQSDFDCNCEYHKIYHTNEIFCIPRIGGITVQADEIPICELCRIEVHKKTTVFLNENDLQLFFNRFKKL